MAAGDENSQWFGSREEALAECACCNPPSKFMENVPVELLSGGWTVSFRLRDDWRSVSTSDRIDRSVRKGERFAVRNDIESNVMTHWRAPFTGGHTAIIPRGTVVVALDDQLDDVPGFYCVPEDYDGMEAVLVPERDRGADKYDGYSLSFVLDDIGTKLEALGPR